MKQSKIIIFILFLLTLLWPKEALVSGPGVNRIVEKYFELSTNDGLSVAFENPEDEIKYHNERRNELGHEMRPTADRIRSLVEQLRQKTPWAETIQPYQADFNESREVTLSYFERAEMHSCVEHLQNSGLYLYKTSFICGMYQVTIRFLLKGKISLSSLYVLEDGLYQIFKPQPSSSQDPGDASEKIMHCSNSEPYQEKLELIRSTFLKLLKQRNLYSGSTSNVLFNARLKGPSLCTAYFQLYLGGMHHWGRVKQAFIETVKKYIPEAREGMSNSLEETWRIEVDNYYDGN